MLGGYVLATDQSDTRLLQLSRQDVDDSFFLRLICIDELLLLACRTGGRETPNRRRERHGVEGPKGQAPSGVPVSVLTAKGKTIDVFQPRSNCAPTAPPALCSSSSTRSTTTSRQ